MKRLTETPVTALYGVGEAKAKSYAKAGVHTIGDLLFHFPRAYENRGNIKKLSETLTDSKSAVVLTVGTEPKRSMLPRRMTLLKFRAFDESGVCEITFFNQDYLKDKFKLGAAYRFYGKVEKIGNKYTMSSPAYEPYTENAPMKDFFAIYPLSEGLSQKQVSGNVEVALKMAADKLPDSLPEEIRLEHGLCTLAFAIKNIHFPDSYESLARAKRRLIFDEFFFFSLGMAQRRKSIRESGAPQCREGDLGELCERLSFELTGAQKRAIDEIKRDMASETPMSRILVGDVGSGKTVCAAAAILFAVRSGYQAALMAPTEILARQHYNDLSKLFGELGIKCSLLIGATTAAEKRKIKEALASPDSEKRIDLVIGTHALLSDGVEFYSPALVVTDEQHRFGVRQRAILSEKSRHSHVLVMSATPIPRSLALVLYGDLDISKIDEMPRGRQRVDTFAVDEGYRERLNAFISKNVAEGGQVYVVCPAVEEKKDDDGELDLYDVGGDIFAEREEEAPLKAAVEYADELQKKLPECRVAFVHGKLKSREKDDIMRRFADGEIDVLVSTTVIEVGVNVPNASLMIVENAERFGLSQLHQLRGRVGRGQRKSYCVLVSDSKSQNARSRLDVMRTTYDGYMIAEKDLKQRGPGDFLSGSSGDSLRQSGGVKFRLADLCNDAQLFTSAAEAAKRISESDPALENHPTLREAVDEMFSLDRDSIS